MTCEDLQHKLLSGGDPHDPEIRAHTRDCDACREFAALRSGVPDSARRVDSAPSTEALRASLRDALAQEQGLVARLRSMPTAQRITLALALAALVAVVEGTLLVRADFDLVPKEVLIGLVLGLVALTLVGTRAVLRPLYRPEIGPRARAALVVLLVTVPVAWSFLQPETGHAASAEGVGFVFWKKALACCAHGLVLASVITLGLFLFDRQLLRSGWAKVAAASLAGVVATLGLQLHCPIPTSAHWLIGHASVGLLLAGALVGYRKLRGD